MPKSQISGPFPPIENIFFLQKFFPSVSIHQKPLEKQKAQRFLAILLFFNPTLESTLWSVTAMPGMPMMRAIVVTALGIMTRAIV